jgi:CBS domain containing-hemolysin-like protein
MESLLIAAIVALVLLGSVLALAEASISRMTRIRAVLLREEGYHNAALLEKIESDPAPYLNAIYLSVMFAQNGSAILLAILADQLFGGLGITVISVAFTVAYFVVVEAMSKTFAVLHSDRVALALAGFVWILGHALRWPTSALIGLSNVLLPGKGLKQGPFVSEEAQIRLMAEVGHESGDIEEHEKEMIHSVFQFGDRIVREIMVPRPDIVAVDVSSPLSKAADLIVERGLTRIPAYRRDLDGTEGIVHAKDVLQALHRGRPNASLTELLRPVQFVPEVKRASELLSEMQRERFHLAMVTDEYGLVSGLVTLEDLLEELVGQIGDEHDREVPDIVPLGNLRYRVNAALPIAELNEALGLDLPHEHWNTVGGLMFGLLGKIPAAGAVVEIGGMQFTAEAVRGRRIVTVILKRLTPAEDEAQQISARPTSPNDR